MADTRERRGKWWTTMIERYGSEEAVREKMRSNADKSARNTGAGGFAYMKAHAPGYHKAVSQIGGINKRGYKKNESQVSQEQG